MGRSSRSGLGLAALLATLGCAHDLRTKFSPATGAETATLVLHFTRPVKEAFLSVNGVPVAEDVHTQRIVVEGVPSGRATVMLAAGGVEKMFTVELESGQRLVVPLAAPDPGVGRTALQAFLTATVYVAYLALRTIL